MKSSHKHDHSHGVSPQLVPVRFEFEHPTATSVCIAGTFNQWEPAAKTMHRSEDGHWLKETMLAPGTYEYCLVVDGRWMPDPRAKEQVPNPFGGKNSVLKVTDPAEGTRPVGREDPKSKSTQPIRK